MAVLIYQVLALRARQRITIRDLYKELVLFNHLLRFNNERSLIQKVFFQHFYFGKFKILSFLHFTQLLFRLLLYHKVLKVQTIYKFNYKI